MRTYLMIAILMLLCSPLLAAQSAVEVWGSNRGAEARYLWLGPAGGAIGLYGGMSDEVMTGDDGVIRGGAVGRYNIIDDGNAPVGNLLPQFLSWFRTTLGLPATTPVDTYVGAEIGLQYGQDDGDWSYEVQPLVGLRVGVLGAEFGRGMGDLLGEQDTPSSWTWNLGLVFEF